MRVEGRIGVAAAVIRLPGHVEKAVDAVAAGRLTAEEAAATGYEELPVSRDESAPEMAAAAARAALERAGWAADGVGLALHAWIYHQGHDFWSPAHYVANEAGLRSALPLGVQQMCNGGAAAVELAVARLLSDPGTTRAVVTTADRFAEPGFDRWRGDYGLWYGDGATALLLDRAPGADLRLLSVTSVAAPELEAMHRGADPFSTAPRGFGERVDVRRTKKAFLGGGGRERFVAAVGEKVSEVIARGLDDAGIAPDDPRIDCVVLPRLGVSALRDIYGPVVSSVTGAPQLDLGGRTGHLGAGDVAAGLATLVAEDRLAPGRIAVLLGAGAGFTWSCLVVRRAAS